MDSKQVLICDTARTYIGTPYHPQGRLKGVGVDCAGLLVCMAQDMNMKFEGDYVSYGHIPDGKKLYATMKKHLKQKPITEKQPGDILLMRFQMEPQHLAVLVEDDEIIHAYLRARKVVKDKLTKEDLDSKVIACFEFPE